MDKRFFYLPKLMQHFPFGGRAGELMSNQAEKHGLEWAHALLVNARRQMDELDSRVMVRIGDGKWSETLNDILALHEHCVRAGAGQFCEDVQKLAEKFVACEADSDRWGLLNHYLNAFTPQLTDALEGLDTVIREIGEKLSKIEAADEDAA